MRKRCSVNHFLILFAAFLLLGLQVQAAGQLRSPATRDERRMESLKEEIRHQLVTLPYYSVFDWLAADVTPDGTVTLQGQATRPTLKIDAETRIKKLEGARQVVNNIEVLPLSSMDDNIRLAAYQAIFKYDSPLFRYATQSVPPIHIIVKNGRLWLKGIVATPMDSQLAHTAARQVPGVFEVHNELQIEGRITQEVSQS